MTTSYVLASCMLLFCLFYSSVEQVSTDKRITERDTFDKNQEANKSKTLDEVDLQEESSKRQAVYCNVLPNVMQPFRSMDVGAAPEEPVEASSPDTPAEEPVETPTDAKATGANPMVRKSSKGKGTSGKAQSSKETKGKSPSPSKTFQPAYRPPQPVAYISYPPTAFRPSQPVAYNPSSPTAFRPPQPVAYIPSSPTAFRPPQPVAYNPSPPTAYIPSPPTGFRPPQPGAYNPSPPTGFMPPQTTAYIPSPSTAFRPPQPVAYRPPQQPPAVFRPPYGSGPSRPPNNVYNPYAPTISRPPTNTGYIQGPPSGPRPPSTRPPSVGYSVRPSTYPCQPQGYYPPIPPPPRPRPPPPPQMRPPPPPSRPPYYYPPSYPQTCPPGCMPIRPPPPPPPPRCPSGCVPIQYPRTGTRTLKDKLIGEKAVAPVEDLAYLEPEYQPIPEVIVNEDVGNRVDEVAYEEQPYDDTARYDEPITPNEAGPELIEVPVDDRQLLVDGAVFYDQPPVYDPVEELRLAEEGAPVVLDEGLVPEQPLE